MEDNVYTNPIMIDVAHNIINDMFVNAIKEKKLQRKLKCIGKS